jgi:hypothetical protein
MSRAAHALRLLSRHPRLVLSGRLPLIACLLTAFAAVLLLIAAHASGARRAGTDCTWGASSVRAHAINGTIKVAPPATSGCIPK